MLVFVGLQVSFYFVSFLVALWFVVYYKYERYLKKYPGPRPVPILGNALEFPDVKDFLTSAKRLQDDFGGIVKTSIGFKRASLLLTNVKALEFFMSSSKVLDKALDYKGLHRWLGFGLLTSTGLRWRKHRKMITPAFHFQILEQYLDTFHTFSDVLIEKMQKECGKDSVNIYPYITLCSLDIICATAMGVTVHAQQDTESEYVKSIKEISRIVMERTLSLIKSHDCFYYFTKDYRKEQKALKVLHGYTNSVIALRKKQLEQQSENNSKDNYDDGLHIKQRKAFLDLLLDYRNNGERLTDSDIRQEVDTFMFEGHDTTSSGVSFILYSLSSHQEIQEKVVEELRTIFSDDKSRKATYKDLQEMRYLELVIKESLRLYPPVPIYGRNVSHEIEYNGTIIPKNTTLTIFPYGLHRSSEYYPDPEKFDPERFTLENQAKRSPYAYIPFSAGPRNCIGQRFAMLEMKSVVSKVLRNYHLLPTNPEHKVKPVGETVLKSSNGIRMRLRNREF